MLKDPIHMSHPQIDGPPAGPVERRSLEKVHSKKGWVEAELPTPQKRSSQDAPSEGDLYDPAADSVDGVVAHLESLLSDDPEIGRILSA